jgi:hypothetical protein
MLLPALMVLELCRAAACALLLLVRPYCCWDSLLLLTFLLLHAATSVRAVLDVPFVACSLLLLVPLLLLESLLFQAFLLLLSSLLSLAFLLVMRLLLCPYYCGRHYCF